jgi:hypothetical protein
MYTRAALVESVEPYSDLRFAFCSVDGILSGIVFFFVGYVTTPSVSGLHSRMVGWLFNNDLGNI